MQLIYSSLVQFFFLIFHFIITILIHFYLCTLGIIDGAITSSLSCLTSLYLGHCLLFSQTTPPLTFLTYLSDKILNITIELSMENLGYVLVAAGFKPKFVPSSGVVLTSLSCLMLFLWLSTLFFLMW